MKAAHTAGTETGFSKHVDEMKGDYPAGTRMKVAHTAGTETEFSKNVHGMKVAHTAGTETFFVKTVNCQTECLPSI